MLRLCKGNYLRNLWTSTPQNSICCLGKYALEQTRIGLHNQEVSRKSKGEITTSELSEYTEFKYVLGHLKIHLDPMMANSNSVG